MDDQEIEKDQGKDIKRTYSYLIIAFIVFAYLAIFIKLMFF